MVHRCILARIELRDGDTFVNRRVIYTPNYRTTGAGAAHTARLICCGIRKSSPTSRTTAVITITITTTAAGSKQIVARMCVLPCPCCLFAVSQSDRSEGTSRSRSWLTIYKFVHLSMRLADEEIERQREREKHTMWWIKRFMFLHATTRLKHVPACLRCVCVCVFMQMLINTLLLLLLIIAAF